MTQAQIVAEISLLEQRLDDLRKQLADQPERIHHFDGATYDHDQDGVRLSRQFERVRDLMLDGKWRTLREISVLLGFPEASVSARLRDLRKPEFGGFHVEHERISGGLWRYRLIDVQRQDTLERVAPSPVVSDESGWAAPDSLLVGGSGVGGPATDSSETTTRQSAIFGWDGE